MKKSSMIKVPKQYWGACKKILNNPDPKCPNKSRGHERVPKSFERAIKITNIMMLKTK
jgi:hypothetical protein